MSTKGACVSSKRSLGPAHSPEGGREVVAQFGTLRFDKPRVHVCGDERHGKGVIIKRPELDSIIERARADGVLFPE